MKQDQQALWRKANDIQRRVREAIGLELSLDLRYSQVYQTYTDFCNDAEVAYTDGLLTPGVVDLLDEYAAKVIEFNQHVPA